MKMTNTRLFIDCLSHRYDVFWRVKDPDKFRYPWTSFKVDPNYLNFDPTTFEYYCDCPIAMWTEGNIGAMYQQFMRTKDLEPLIKQCGPFNPFGDYWEYSGFIRRLDDSRYYHVKMSYNGQWIGIWEVEDGVN